MVLDVRQGEMLFGDIRKIIVIVDPRVAMCRKSVSITTKFICS